MRRWETSTNTRYLCMGAAEYLNAFNQQFDTLQHRVRIVSRFNIVPRRDATSPRRLERVTAEFAPQGDYAIFEFTGGLPRAKLYSNWQINTNNEAILTQLVAPSFDVTHSVFVNGGLPAGVTNADTNQNTGTVEFASYSPKDIVLNAHAANASVLLLNDRFDPNWKVSVDGQPAPLLKCNYLMRGVYLEAGDHKVEFKFLPPVRALYVSLAARRCCRRRSRRGPFHQSVGKKLLRLKSAIPAPATAPRPQPAAITPTPSPNSKPAAKGKQGSPPSQNGDRRNFSFVGDEVTLASLTLPRCAHPKELIRDSLRRLLQSVR